MYNYYDTVDIFTKLMHNTLHVQSQYSSLVKWRGIFGVLVQELVMPTVLALLDWHCQ